MDSLRIEGGVPLKGEIVVSGAKNAALPLIAAGLVTDGTLRLRNVPDLVDTGSMEVLLRNHGMDVGRTGDLLVIGGSATNFDAPYDLVRKMRASILVLGPLLARYGQARVSLPGGCAIGTRPVDLHIRAMQAFGAIVELALVHLAPLLLARLGTVHHHVLRIAGALALECPANALLRLAIYRERVLRARLLAVRVHVVGICRAFAACGPGGAVLVLRADTGGENEKQQEHNI